MSDHRYYNVQYGLSALTLFSLSLGPPDSDHFTELRGVIPRSFEYLFFLINREVNEVSRIPT